MTIRIETATEPFDDPALLLRAAAVLARAEAMGLIELKTPTRLDRALLVSVVRQLADHGIGGALRPLASTNMDASRATLLVDRLTESLDGSPAPEHEARVLAELLGAALLARLVGVSPVTVNRWLRGVRTPEGIHGARLHWLTAVVADLRGAYNTFGVRRWFERPRTQLDGRSPLDALGEDWDPDDEPARKVRELAAWLTSPAAT